MKEKVKRGVILTSSGVLILIGLLGLILPIIPGIPILIVGLTVLGIDTPKLFRKYIS